MAYAWAGAGGWIIVFFSFFVSFVGFFTSSSLAVSCPRFQGQVTLNKEKKVYLWTNFEKKLGFIYFLDMMHSQSLMVLNTLNISAHRGEPQLSVLTANSERF